MPLLSGRQLYLPGGGLVEDWENSDNVCRETESRPPRNDEEHHEVNREGRDRIFTTGVCNIPALRVLWGANRQGLCTTTVDEKIVSQIFGVLNKRKHICSTFVKDAGVEGTCRL
ncbi:hypothetical protein Bbelb_206950 [Branchiostoma belcheri]|nr:hypothetical protein Bbelb_206950 [Branchiostoma belcheri]